MKVLLLGSGGRENALAWALAASPRLTKLYCTPGNPGTAVYGENIKPALITHRDIRDFCLEQNIDMIVVGPETPLVNGIYNFIKSDPDTAHIIVVGPSKEGAMLEGSKDFAKEFMMRHQIPTAAYETFTRESLFKGFQFIDSLQAPYVLKADGLAAGKGVLILNDPDEAKRELSFMLGENKFGIAGSKVVIEEFMHGIECSVFVLTDGTGYVLLPHAKDYKRIGEGDTGLNTGGMGAISPVPFLHPELMAKIKSRVIEPTIKGLHKENIVYKGFVYIGLMIVDDNPFVVEYNVRLGDPEAEVILPRIKTDLIDLFEAMEDERLSEITVEQDERAAVTVIAASEGYPGNYPTGFNITGLQADTGSIIFHSGTKMDGVRTLTAGGRVLAVTSYGNSLQEALDNSYETLSGITFDGIYYRRDIGHDVLKFIPKK